MATATKEQQEKDADEFAQQFDAPDAVKKEPTEDEAFGLNEPPATEAEGATTDTGGAADADAGATAAAPAVDAGAADAGPSDKEKELAEREAALSAREAELAAREASIETTNVGETQHDGGDDLGGGNGEGGEGGEGGDDDPAKLLADDFGPDFVHLLTRFIKQICATEVGNGIGSVSATVDAVIHHLTSERQANHFKAIKAAHDDFQEIVDSPAFGAWKESQSPEQQASLQRVIDSGSAQEIIDMLTAFKESRGSGSSAVDESALDDAEGVRSGGGMSLPKEPPASDDYARAWAEA